MNTSEYRGLDTNILVFADDASNTYHAAAKHVLEAVFLGETKACLSPQVLAEYYSVITSPKRVRSPLSPEEAKGRILFLNQSRILKKIHPKRSTLKRSVEHCAQHGIRSAQLFDILYAQTLLDNGVRTLLTQNTKDFRTFENLNVQNPFI